MAYCANCMPCGARPRRRAAEGRRFRDAAEDGVAGRGGRLAAMTAADTIAAGLAASPLANSQRIVVKIGSALLVDARQGAIRRAWLDALIDDLAVLRAAGRQVVLVSSGAIAVGRQDLGLPAGSCAWRKNKRRRRPVKFAWPTPIKMLGIAMV